MLALIENFNYRGVLADKGYDSDEILKTIANAGAVAVIPPKKHRIIQRKYDREIYKKRHKIENLFSFLNIIAAFFHDSTS